MDIVLFGLLFVVSTSILGLVEERARLLQTIETLRQSNAVLEEENRALRAQCATSQNSSQRPSVFLTRCAASLGLQAGVSAVGIPRL